MHRTPPPPPSPPKNLDKTNKNGQIKSSLGPPPPLEIVNRVTLFCYCTFFFSQLFTQLITKWFITVSVFTKPCNLSVVEFVHACIVFKHVIPYFGSHLMICCWDFFFKCQTNRYLLFASICVGICISLRKWGCYNYTMRVFS